jgi:predicted short-subunit dehydrogenase-like oxidoreductase (DUF2520 family)
MNITFIGSGNLAWHLAPALDNAGFVVKEVYSREPKHAHELVNRLYQADVCASLDFSLSPSQLFIIAVTDDVIENIAREIILPEQAILVHTSGSKPLDVLHYAATPHAGVFYPLQTFSKAKKVDFQDIPIFIESDEPHVEEVLLKIGKAISKKVQVISGTKRAALHVAAVFASNFTNHMLSISKSVMENHQLNFELLKPLIAETINKGLAIGPENAQTGPAKRGDLQTLDKHMEILEYNPALAEIYKIVSQHVLDQYFENESN